MRRRILQILLLCSATMAFAARPIAKEPARIDVAPRDTTDFGEDNDDVELVKPTKEQGKEGEEKKPIERTGFDAMEYALSRRYHAMGEEFGKEWYDHLFIQAGVGLEQMVPPASNYRFKTLTAVNVGIGKQFNRYNSARLTLHGAWGYQDGKDRLFTKYGVRLEHMFSLTSFFYGFQPSRLVDVSTIFGVGAQYSKLSFKNILYEEEMQKRLEAFEQEGNKVEADIIRQNWPKDKSGASVEAHIGAQLRFFTGPQGYINIEPYLGMATDKMDLSQNQNWRKIDVFYGVNFNYIYFLRNNLSKRERQYFIKHRQEHDQIDNDSSYLQSWQQPWFVEYSNGVNFLTNSQLGAGSSMGSDFSLSIGRWLSPVIGLRLTGSVHQTTWRKDFVATNDPAISTALTGYDAFMHNIYTGIRLDALFNPLGFLKSFSWDKPYGAYVVGGVEYGWVDKYQNKRLSTRSESYSGGLHLWYQLSDGLHFFVEPRYMHYVYKLPYTEVDWNKNFTDDAITVSFGLQMATRSSRFRHHGENEVYEPLWKIRAGISGGFYEIHTKKNFEGDGGVGVNAKVFGEYHLTPIHSARASFEYLPVKHSNLVDYKVVNTINGGSTTKYGMWNHKFNLGLISLGYQANLSNLFCGYPSWRRFDLSAFLGPTFIIPVGDNSELSTNETLFVGEEVQMEEPMKVKSGMGAHLGFKLRFKIVPHISAIFEPTFYFLGNTELPSVDFLTVKYLQTLNFGVQYEL